MSLFDDASLIVTPNGYKAGKLYSIKPFDGSGDFDVVRATGATRVNENGLIELVGNNVPRIDYPPLGGCPSILVEPQRTNLLLKSEEFDDVYWRQDIGINTTGTPPRVNVEIAPDGTQTADKIIEDTSTGGHAQARTLVIPSGIHTVSMFVKPDERTFFYLGNGSVGHYAFFNLSNGTIVGTVGVTVSNPFIIPYPNGWYRVGCIITDNVARSFIFGMSLDGVNISYTGDGTSGLFIWGAQLEAGSNATSYIPTTSATVTRNADVIDVTTPVGVTEITETFENNTTNVITTIPATYQMSEGRIKTVLMK